MATVAEPTFFNFTTLGINACAKTASPNQGLIINNFPIARPQPSAFTFYPIVIPVTVGHAYAVG